jgi:integrase/recombinase XerD
MVVLALTSPAVLLDHDPLRDKAYRDTALGPAVVDWLAYLELGGAAQRTLDQYERDLARLCLMYPSKGLAELGDGDLAHVVRSWPAGSRRVRKAALDSFFRWAIRTRRLERNPMQLLPVVKRPAQKHIDVFSDAEIEALTALPLVDGALMLTLLDAGLRKSEARHLQLQRLRLDTGELIVIGGKGDKDRVVPMTLRLQQAIAELVLLEGLEPNDHLWYVRPGGGPIRRDVPMGEGSFDRWWRRCVSAAGIRYRNPHTTRHTFATRWLRRGGRLETLSLVMGHSSIRTTHDLYAHLDVADIAADLAIIEARDA